MKASIRVAKARYEDRHGRRLTNIALAHKIGVSRNTIQRWLRGDFSEFNLGTLEKLCQALECEVSDILWMEEINGNN